MTGPFRLPRTRDRVSPAELIERGAPALRIATALLGVGAVVLALLIVVAIVRGGGGDTPRTEMERGVMAAEEAVTASPNDPAARTKLAAAYLEAGSPRLAEEQARTALRLAPDDPAAFYVLGMAQLDLGRTTDAVGSLGKAATTAGQVAQFYQDAYLALARAQEKAGDDEAARKAFQKSLDYGPENALVLFERGRFFERKGEWANAMYDYGWALTYEPNYKEAGERLSALAQKYPAEFEKVRQLESRDASDGVSP